MPRYFFHCAAEHHGTVDDIGAELADAAAARAYALDMARRISAAAQPVVTNWSGWTIGVTDETGRRLLTVRFSDALES